MPKVTNENLQASSVQIAHPDLPATWSRRPTRLCLPPNSLVDPPTITRPQKLPVRKLTWQDFERLCLRLIELEVDVIGVSEIDLKTRITDSVARQYGTPGQAQFGIDIFARDRLSLVEAPPQRRYVTLQARRIESLSARELNESAEEFLGGPWASVTRKFIFATSASTKSTKLTDPVEKLTDKLLAESIEFVVWDEEAISRRLKDLPEIVDDFFGRAWVAEFCGPDAVTMLGTRLDTGDVTKLRNQLSQIYTASFGVSDSGHIVFRTRDMHPIDLRNRFVTPDLVSATPTSASLPQPIAIQGIPGDDHPNHQLAMEEAATWDMFTPDEGAWFRLERVRKEQREGATSHVLERRPADQWIGTEPLQIIVGEPGAGKSTILRYLVLDLLSEEPNWQTVAEQWGQCLPVWLPFHFFTQRVADQTGTRASVSDALRAWLEQHDAGQTWPLVEKALKDSRLLLVVDGLDEWINEEAGSYAIFALETFAESQTTRLIVSTRPYGLARLSLGAGWTYKRIAPLTPEQQKQLSSAFFYGIAKTDTQPLSQSVIEQSVDDFLSRIHDAADLRAISTTPLFLVFLVGLHLSNLTTLPSERFGIYDQAVTLLVADHPAKRRTAAAVTASRRTISNRRLRAVLSRIAFICQMRGSVPTVHEATLHRDFVETLQDPTQLAMSAEQSVEVADQLLDIAEGELGLLVRMGPTELGFLHRILQEQLAAEYISDQVAFSEQKELFAEHVGNPAWREVLLATMWRLTRPTEMGELIDVIRNAIDDTPQGLHAREILAEVTFGPFELPTVDVKRGAAAVIRAIETHPFVPHRVRLLDSVLSGLEDPVTGEIVEECLGRWTLLVQEPSVELVSEVGQIPAGRYLSELVCQVLIQTILSPNSVVAYSGASAVAERFLSYQFKCVDESEQVKAELVGILRDPPSGLAQAAALAALALVWRDDPLVTSMLKSARRASDDSVKLVALGDALGLLPSIFLDHPNVSTNDVSELDCEERAWLVNQIKQVEMFTPFEFHQYLLIESVAEVVKAQPSLLSTMLESVELESAPYRNLDLVWSVILSAFPDDEQVADAVCRDLSQAEHSLLVMGVFANEYLLGAYAGSSVNRDRIGMAVEQRLGEFDVSRSSAGIFRLAVLDRGPIMKKCLLEDFARPRYRSWCAEILAEHFANQSDVHSALVDVLMGEAATASMVANVATRVLSPDDVFPRLIEILQGLCECDDVNRRCYDVVVSAIVRAHEDLEFESHREFEDVAERALSCLSCLAAKGFHNLCHRLVLAFYPSDASCAALKDLSQSDGRPLAAYIRAFRDHPAEVEPFVELAVKVVCSLPAYLRGRVCQMLADRAIASDELVLRLTCAWADEVSPLNKSVASLAYHQALVRARERQDVDDAGWHMALSHLGRQASSSGFDFEARRRSAWVGMCVCGDWSPLEGRSEEIDGQSAPVAVPITDQWYGPDVICLQQLATRWVELRGVFGDELLFRFSMSREDHHLREVWGTLAAVATRDSLLNRELAHAVSEDPDLLQLRGVLMWFVTHGNAEKDALARSIVAYFVNNEFYDDKLASFVIVDPMRFGLEPDDLSALFDTVLEDASVRRRDAIVAALAMLCPQHPAVRAALPPDEAEDVGGETREFVSITSPTDFVVACAVLEGSAFLNLLYNNFRVLSHLCSSYHDGVFSRHVCLRLRRDSDVADLLRSVVLRPETSDDAAALLVSLLAEAIGLDEVLLSEVERRAVGQRDLDVAPVVWDHGISAALSLRTVLTRVSDAIRSESLA